MNISLLSKICEIPGAPGNEDQVRDFVIEEITPFVDDITVDNMGNIIAVKKSGKSGAKKLMSAAHMDEIGFIVKYIDDNGFIKFHTLGGFDPKTLTSQRVIVHGTKDLIGVMGSKPIHIMSDAERNTPPKIGDYFIDLGLPKEEVEKYISVGDTITRDRQLIEMGDCVNCKSLDNRVSVFILIEALKNIKKLSCDFYAVFTVQEEVGLRGATVATHAVNPDFGIALDTTIAFDTPGAKPEESVTKLGNGTAIKIMDSSTIADKRMVAFLKDLAISNGISWQPEILPAGGTDTAAIQRAGKNGSIAGAISIPTRHIHQVIEMVNKEDVDGAIQLLVKAVQHVGTYKGW